MKFIFHYDTDWRTYILLSVFKSFKMMVNRTTNLQSLQAEPTNLKLPTNSMPLQHVFAERRGSYLNEFN